MCRRQEFCWRRINSIDYRCRNEWIYSFWITISYRWWSMRITCRQCVFVGMGIAAKSTSWSRLLLPRMLCAIAICLRSRCHGIQVLGGYCKIKRFFQRCISLRNHVSHWIRFLRWRQCLGRCPRSGRQGDSLKSCGSRLQRWLHVGIDLQCRWIIRCR